MRPPSCAPPPPRSVGSRGRGFPQDWTVCPFLRRLSAARLPIMPHISSHFWLERMNSASLACVSRREKSIGTMDWCMSFVVFERKNGKFSVLQPCFGMPGGVILPMICHGSVFCLIRGRVVNSWLSAFERELELEEARGALQRYSVTIKFQEVTTPFLIMYIYLIYKWLCSIKRGILSWRHLIVTIVTL